MNMSVWQGRGAIIGGSRRVPMGTHGGGDEVRPPMAAGEAFAYDLGSEAEVCGTATAAEVGGMAAEIPGRGLWDFIRRLNGDGTPVGIS